MSAAKQSTVKMPVVKLSRGETGTIRGETVCEISGHRVYIARCNFLI